MSEQNLIKGTITIIYKPKLISWFTYNSQQYESQTKIYVIVSFDSDQMIVDLMENKTLFESTVSTKNELMYDETIEFTKAYRSSVPLYYSNKKKNKTYFNFTDDEKTERDKQLKLIFSDNITSEIDRSFYNCMFYYKNYYKSNDDKYIALVIRKLKFGSDSHRYIFAYDSNEFSREKIQIILYYIFCLEK